jgi:dihydropteroate synthase
MTESNSYFININSIKEAKREIQKIGSDPKSIEIMAPKAVTKIIKVEKVILQDAIIIKQDMLSVGGEVAVPQNTFKLHGETGNILIIGTVRQLNDLVIKLDRHYPRLKKIAEKIAIMLKEVE